MATPYAETKRFAFYIVGDGNAINIFDKVLSRSLTISVDDLEEALKGIKNDNNPSDKNTMQSST